MKIFEKENNYLRKIPVQYLNYEEILTQVNRTGIDKNFTDDVARCIYESYLDSKLNGGGYPRFYELIYQLKLLLFSKQNASKIVSEAYKKMEMAEYLHKK